MNKLTFHSFHSLINNINLEVLEHGYFYGDSTWKYYNTSSPFNRIYFVMDGEGTIEGSSGNTCLQAGNMYLIPLHTTNNYICNDRLEKFYLHFRIELFGVQDLFENAGSCLCLPFEKDSAGKLIEKAKSDRIEDIIYCKAFIFETLSKFIEAFLIHSLDHPFHVGMKYQKVFRYINEHCSAGLKMNNLSQYTSMSVSNLNRSFKLDTGISLKDYIDKKLIQKAKEMLVLSDSSIKEIAFQLRFSDEFYFSRFFKRLAGVPPKSYRKSNVLKYPMKYDG